MKRIVDLTLTITFIAALHFSSVSLADGRQSTGYLSAVTHRVVVMEGVTYRLRPNMEERDAKPVEFVFKGRSVAYEDLDFINPRKTAKAKITFDRAGYVIRVHILDEAK